MRPLLILLLLTASAFAQDSNTTLPADFFSAIDIEQAAICSVNELEARVKALEAAVAKLKSCECTCECGKAKAVSPWKITLETIPGCDPCKIAKATQPQIYQPLNWQWETNDLKVPVLGHRYPRYIICDGKTCAVIECHPSDFDRRLRELLESWKQPSMLERFKK